MKLAYANEMEEEDRHDLLCQRYREEERAEETDKENLLTCFVE